MLVQVVAGGCFSLYTTPDPWLVEECSGRELMGFRFTGGIVSLSITKYHLLGIGSTQEDQFLHDCKIVDWDIIKSNKQNHLHSLLIPNMTFVNVYCAPPPPLRLNS